MRFWGEVNKARRYNDLIDTYHNYQESTVVGTSDYFDIANSFNELGDYKEAEQYCKLSLEAEANLYWDVGNYKEAYKLLKKLGYNRDNNEKICSMLEEDGNLELLASEPGDVITFGRYEQDGNLENGYEDLKWVVLESNGTKRLLVTEDCIESMPYNFEKGKTNWNESTVNNWLNTYMVTEMFGDCEREKLITSLLESSINPKYGTEYEKAEGVLFFLSLQELKEYSRIKNGKQAWVKATLSNYMITRGASVCTGYWVRTPGIDYDGAVYVTDTGFIQEAGEGCIKLNLIRPAVWIDILAEEG